MKGLQPDESIFLTPEFNEKESAWIEHIPFAFWISKVLKPETFVELGTHFGNSYFAFCQAFKEYSIQTKAFAVDHWKGDEHAGFYDENVYSYVSGVNQNHFEEFSTLLKMTFDEAAETFDDSQIDLLHIDGMHSYEAVKHDFYNWLPKMSKKGVILLHDTQVKKEGFGVWRFFEELRDNYPVFEFTHGFGLGIVCVGEEVNQKWLDFIADHKDDSYIRQLFESLGKKISISQRLGKLEKTVQQQGPGVAQLFFTEQDEGFSESQSIIVPIQKNQQKVTFTFDEAVEIQQLRFDPVNDYAHIRLHSIQIFCNGNQIDTKVKLTSNGYQINKNDYLFPDIDPQLHIHFPKREKFKIDEIIIEITYLAKGKMIIPALQTYLKN